MQKLESLPNALKLIRRTPLGNRLGIMEILFGSSLENKGIRWVNTAADIPWKIDFGEPCHRWMIYGDYAGTNFLTWARNNVPTDGVIVDSGSNIGQFLPYFSKIVPDGLILSYEPSSYCYGWLQDCLKENPELPIQLHNFGLGEGESELFFEDQNHAAHGLWGTIKQHSNDSNNEKVEIQSLDDQISTREFLKIDLWKLDVEGFEVQALKGAKKLL